MVLVYLLKRGNQELYPPGAVQDDCPVIKNVTKIGIFMQISNSLSSVLTHVCCKEVPDRECWMYCVCFPQYK